MQLSGSKAAAVCNSTCDDGANFQFEQIKYIILRLNLPIPAFSQ